MLTAFEPLAQWGNPRENWCTESNTKTVINPTLRLLADDFSIWVVYGWYRSIEPS